jgi:hypothetical protein
LIPIGLILFLRRYEETGGRVPVSGQLMVHELRLMVHDEWFFLRKATKVERTVNGSWLNRKCEENCTKVKGKCRKKEENVADYDKKHQNLVFLCLNESRKM